MIRPRRFKESKEVKSKKIIWKKDGVKAELIIDNEVAARTIQRNSSESSPKRIVWKKDEAEMVLIPATSFEMGDHFSEGLEMNCRFTGWN